MVRISFQSEDLKPLLQELTPVEHDILINAALEIASLFQLDSDKQRLIIKVEPI